MEYRMRGLWTYRNSTLYSLSELLHPRNQGNCQASPRIYRDELDHPPIRCQETLLAQRQTKEYHGGPRQVDQRSPRDGPQRLCSQIHFDFGSLGRSSCSLFSQSCCSAFGWIVRGPPSQSCSALHQDSATTDPEYDAIKSFILTEDQTNQTMAAYDSER